MEEREGIQGKPLDPPLRASIETRKENSNQARTTYSLNERLPIKNYQIKDSKKFIFFFVDKVVGSALKLSLKGFSHRTRTE